MTELNMRTKKYTSSEKLSIRFLILMFNDFPNKNFLIFSYVSALRNFLDAPKNEIPKLFLSRTLHFV